MAEGGEGGGYGVGFLDLFHVDLGSGRMRMGNAFGRIPWDYGWLGRGYWSQNSVADGYVVPSRPG